MHLDESLAHPNFQNKQTKNPQSTCENIMVTHCMSCIYFIYSACFFKWVTFIQAKHYINCFNKSISFLPATVSVFTIV